MRTIIGSVLLGLTLASLGCGTIFNGTRATIAATSTPEAVKVVANPGGVEYTTPASMSLERKHDYVLTFSLEGYQSATFHIEKRINGGILVLDILAGLLGIVIDAATGGWYSLEPKTASVTMVKTTASVEGPDTIEILVVGGDGTLEVQSSMPGVGMTVEAK